MLLCKATGWYRPHLGSGTLLYSQAALVSFATTGEKTVAAVVTCRSEVVSIESSISSYLPGTLRAKSRGGWNAGGRKPLRNKFSLVLQNFLHTPLSPGMNPNITTSLFPWGC